MKLELLASWAETPADLPFRDWWRVAPGLVGVHLADHRLLVRRATAGAEVAGGFPLPPTAKFALDPRGQTVAWATGSGATLVTLAGAVLREAPLAPGFVVQQVDFRADGARLWVFGAVGKTFHAYAFDRELNLVGDHHLELALDPSPFPIHVHPGADAFVLSMNEDDTDPESAVRRMGFSVKGAGLEVAFDEGEIDHPCLGFTRDGSRLVGADAFNGVMTFTWPQYDWAEEAEHPEGFEGRFDGVVVGDHLLTERHEQDSTDSALLVLSLPGLDEEAEFPWAERGDFGTPEDDAGLDVAAALGDDTFLETTKGEAGWTFRVWRLAP